MAGDFEEKMRRAEAAVAALAADFPSYIAEDLERAEAGMAEALDQPAGPARDAAMGEVHAAGHNIKGLGGSFGFDLVTDVGQSLCLLLKLAPENTDAVVALAETHVAELRRILDAAIAGDGGADGRALMQTLNAAREALIGKTL